MPEGEDEGMKIAVVGGAGKFAAGVIKDFLAKETKGIEKVAIMDVNEEKMQALKDEFKDDRLETNVVDVRDRKELSRKLEEADVCVNEINIWVYPDLARDVMNACLDAECNYTDLGVIGLYVMELKEEFHEKFIEKNISAIIGMGSAPGSTNVLAKYCVEQLDKVWKIETYGISEDLGPKSPVFDPYYDVESICSEYGQPSYQFIDGELKKMPPRSGEQTIFCPEPIGKTECWHPTHSEPTTLSYVFKDKGVKEVTHRQKRPTHESKIAKSLMACGFGDPEPLEIEGIRVVPRKFLKMLVARNVMKNKGKIIKPEKEYSMIRVVTEGEKEGRKCKYTIDRRGGHGTIANQSYGAQLLAKGEIKPGVWFPEQCIDTEKYFEYMKKKGFKYTVTKEEEMVRG